CLGQGARQPRQAPRQPGFRRESQARSGRESARRSRPPRCRSRTPGGGTGKIGLAPFPLDGGKRSLDEGECAASAMLSERPPPFSEEGPRQNNFPTARRLWLILFDEANRPISQSCVARAPDRPAGSCAFARLACLQEDSPAESCGRA